jgi:uncharacterized membrane protein YfcA
MHLLVDGRPVSLIGVALLGAAVGYVAGMFGVGGGFLLTPLLTVVFDVSPAIAVGTGLCQMIGTATVALLRHRGLKQGELRFDLLLIGGSLLGVDAGARALTQLDQAAPVALLGGRIAAARLAVDGLYVLLLLGCSALFFFQARGAFDPLEFVRPGPLARLPLPPYVDLPSVPLRRVSATGAALVGLGLGLLSGMLGIGGGVALMPILIYGYGFPLRQAAGTGILALLVTAAFGTFEHALRGHVHLGLAAVLLVGASISAQLGALATHRLPARALRRAFALVVLATVAAVLWDLAARLR